MVAKTIVTADEATLIGPTGNILREKCSTVVDYDEGFLQVVQDLQDTLHSDSLSVGLAAPQIGYDIAVTVVNLSKEDASDLVMVNPEILQESGQWDEKYESCMSIPHKKGKVKRRKKILVRYQDVGGAVTEREFTSFEARVIMHEVDHLNGVLFVDRMEEGVALEDTDMFKEHGID